MASDPSNEAALQESYEVVGAGDRQVNGKYLYMSGAMPLGASGLAYHTHWYQQQHGEHRLYLDHYHDLGYWYLVSEEKRKYFAPGTINQVPCNGWQIVDGLDDFPGKWPAPSLFSIAQAPTPALPPTKEPTLVNYVFFGTPGKGKSTIANCLAGEVLFKAGLSGGSGLTTEVDTQYCKKLDCNITDTMGFTDVKLEIRKKGSAAITNLFRSGGRLKIMFVIGLYNSRIQDEDRTAMKMVLRAAPTIKNRYGIVVNSCSPEILRRSRKAEWKREFETLLLHGLPDDTEHICYMGRKSGWEDKDDVVDKLDDAVIAFFDSVPVVELKSDAVVDIKNSSLDDLMGEIMKQKDDLKRLELRLGREEAKELHARQALEDAHWNFFLDNLGYDRDLWIHFETKMSECEVVDVISTPYYSAKHCGAEKAEETKNEHHNPPYKFCVNPNKDLEKFARSIGFDADMQGKRWLQLWARCLRQCKLKGGTVYFMKGKSHARGEFDGNAQYGEYEFAMIAEVDIKFIEY